MKFRHKLLASLFFLFDFFLVLSIVIYLYNAYFQIPQQTTQISFEALYSDEKNTPKSSNDVDYTQNTNPITLYNECSSLEDCQERFKITDDDPACQNSINEALDLLETKSPDDYYYALKFIGTVRCEEKGSGTYVWSDPPDVILGKSTIDGGTVWLAGVFVHEARHAELYREYLNQNPQVSAVPEEIYSGEAAEQKCLDKQYDALVAIGADQSTLDYIKQVIKDKWWEVEYKDRWW